MIEVVVYGKPAPAGSKKAVPFGKSGKWGVIDDSKRSRPWKDQVAQWAGVAMAMHPMLRGPIRLDLTFVVARPKGHYGKKGLLPSAPAYPTVKPDVLKLARGVEDALSGIVYNDDAQIVDERLTKVYGEPERVEIRAEELNGGNQ